MTTYHAYLKRRADKQFEIVVLLAPWELDADVRKPHGEELEHYTVSRRWVAVRVGQESRDMDAELKAWHQGRRNVDGGHITHCF